MNQIVQAWANYFGHALQLIDKYWKIGRQVFRVIFEKIYFWR